MKRFFGLVYFAVCCSITNLCCAAQFEKCESFFKDTTPYQNVNAVWGRLTVPENRDEDNGKTIQLAVAILKSKKTQATNTPIVFIVGGPGFSPIIDIQHWLKYQYHDNHDVILMDMRGTGFSEPLLSQDSIKKVAGFRIKNSTTEKEQSLAVQQAFLLRDCALQEGINLRQFNSRINAADFNDLFHALQYDSYNILSISYGARVAQTIMRNHPDKVRCVILDSPVTVTNNPVLESKEISNYVRSLEIFFSDIAGNQRCVEKFPGLKDHFYELVDSFRANTVQQSKSNPEQNIVFFGADLLKDTCGFMLSKIEMIPYIPQLMQQLYQNREQTVRKINAYAATEVGKIDPKFQLVYHSTLSYEVYPFVRIEDVLADSAKNPRMGNDRKAFREQQFISQNWPSGQADPAELQPVVSGIPTLLFAGSYDPVTPPENGQIIGKTLKKHYYAEFPRFTHVVFDKELPSQIALKFIANPEQNPVPETISQPPIEFVTDIYHRGSVFFFLNDLQNNPFRWDTVCFAIVTFTLNLNVVYLITCFLMRFFRRNTFPLTTTQFRRLLLLGTTNVLTAGYVVVLFSVIGLQITRDPFLLLFGLPAYAKPIFIMPCLLLLLTVLDLFFCIRTWNIDFSRNSRIYHGILVSMLFVNFIIMMKWGLWLP